MHYLWSSHRFKRVICLLDCLVTLKSAENMKTEWSSFPESYLSARLSRDWKQQDVWNQSGLPSQSYLSARLSSGSEISRKYKTRVVFLPRELSTCWVSLSLYKISGKYELRVDTLPKELSVNWIVSSFTLWHKQKAWTQSKHPFKTVVVSWFVKHLFCTVGYWMVVPVCLCMYVRACECAGEGVCALGKRR